MQASRVAVASFALALAGLPLPAQTSERIQVHAFGGWSFAQTNDNRYLGGSRTGAFDNANLAVAALASPTRAFRINVQGELRAGEGELEAEIDYAFVEWRFTDALRVRGGLVKHAFGIFAEVFDVGTIRPFYALPQSVYGAAGVMAENLTGLALTGRLDSQRWGFEYDLYGGSIALNGNTIPAALAQFHGEDPGELENHNLSGVVGGRVVLAPPIPGLRLGVSAFTGKGDGREDGSRERLNTAALLAEYIAETWSLRSEAALSRDEHLLGRGAYVEATRRVIGPLNLALRYDWSVPRLSEPVDVDPDLLRHREKAVGLNYWISPTFVTRLSFHAVDGRRYTAARSDDDVSTRRTRLVILGAQLSF